MQAGDVLFDGPGARLRGHLALPAGATGPGLLLVPDVRGLSDHYRDVARPLRRRRLRHSRRRSLQSGGRARSRATWTRSCAGWRRCPTRACSVTSAAAARYLRARSECRGGVGITGFCMGGQYALLAACTQATFDACVSWYGMLRYARRRRIGRAVRSTWHRDCSVRTSGSSARTTRSSRAPTSTRCATILTRAAKRFAIRTFAGCGHAFFNDTRPDAYRPAPAAEAFRLAVAFLRQHLDAL